MYRIEIPQRRIRRIIKRILPVIRKHIRHHSMMHIFGKCQKDFPRICQTIRTQCQARKRNHRIAAPVRKPRKAGQNGLVSGRIATHNQRITRLYQTLIKIVPSFIHLAVARQSDQLLHACICGCHYFIHSIQHCCTIIQFLRPVRIQTAKKCDGLFFMCCHFNHQIQRTIMAIQAIHLIVNLCLKHGIHIIVGFACTQNAFAARQTDLLPLHGPYIIPFLTIARPCMVKQLL